MFSWGEAAFQCNPNKIWLFFSPLYLINAQQSRFLLLSPPLIPGRDLPVSAASPAQRRTAVLTDALHSCSFSVLAGSWEIPSANCEHKQPKLLPGGGSDGGVLWSLRLSLLLLQCRRDALWPWASCRAGGRAESNFRLRSLRELLKFYSET